MNHRHVPALRSTRALAPAVGCEAEEAFGLPMLGILRGMTLGLILWLAAINALLWLAHTI